ncbi:recombination protein NinB [Comamonas terrigena]|uniref:recombination protein NinB n=1 Tax=Comamonas terrigena TaxID=32013 RepID=UPI002448FC91|nr:recombination protein NinB [Comamonas terrigena]MDH1291327.1 recombination protein NinB [Comamonas terrigena]
MSEQLEIDLFSRRQAWVAIRAQLFPFLAQAFQGFGRWVLTVARRKRSRAQNRRYWGQGVLAQIAQQAVVNGRQYDAQTWHELLKRRFIGVVELPDGAVVGASSTRLSPAEFAAFCARVEAYAASELGVTFYDLWEGG